MTTGATRERSRPAPPVRDIDGTPHEDGRTTPRHPPVPGLGRRRRDRATALPRGYRMRHDGATEREAGPTLITTHLDRQPADFADVRATNLAVVLAHVRGAAPC